MKIEDLMTKNVVTIETGDNLVKAAQKMSTENVGSLPVLENSKFVGILTDRDIVVRSIAKNENPEATMVRVAMTDNPITISPDLDVQDAASIMVEHQIRRLPVLEDTNLVGIVTLGDLAVDAKEEIEVEEVLEEVSQPVK